MTALSEFEVGGTDVHEGFFAVAQFTEPGS